MLPETNITNTIKGKVPQWLIFRLRATKQITDIQRSVIFFLVVTAAQRESRNKVSIELFSSNDFFIFINKNRNISFDAIVTLPNLYTQVDRMEGKMYKIPTFWCTFPSLCAVI